MSPTHSVFILPALLPARRSNLTLLVLADGNRRGGGYGSGARAVVTVAEHLARRADVAAMVACILSPDNIAKRGDEFFADLHAEMVRLGVAVQTRGALVDAGVRLGVTGDLGALRARGGHAAGLADAIEAVIALTARVERPALRLLLGVGYRADVVAELDVDVVLRTGMEEPDALRLSGLRPHARAVYAASARLWPAITPGDVDAVLDAAKQRAAPGLAGGHGPDEIVALVAAMAARDLGAPLRVMITSRAPSSRLVPALDRLFLASLRVAVRYLGDAASPKRQCAEGAPHELWIAPGSPSHRTQLAAGCHSVLAPAQAAPFFVLPDWLLLGHAAVHACDASAHGLVEGLSASRTFLEKHPPLQGAERAVSDSAALPEAPWPARVTAAVEAITQGEPHAAAALSASSDPDARADAFAARLLGWASTAGLLLPDPAARRAALGYAITGLLIHQEVPAPWDRAAAAWEDRAELAARYMLLVAAGDDGLFDRALPGELPAARLARLEACGRFLGEALRDDPSRAAPPPTPDAPLLTAIATGFRDLAARYRHTAHPALFAAFRAGLTDLYRASVAEHGSAISGARLAHRITEGGPAGADASRAIDDRCAAAPPCIAARARDLRDRLAHAPDAALSDELTVLLYLAGAGSAIGAGLLFRVIALAAPAASVPADAIPALASAAALLDYGFRLSNDATGFLASPRGDRDDKENSCSLLVSPDLTGPPRALAVIHALATSRRLAAWIEQETAREIARLSLAWPWMGLVLRRGVFVGRRIYELGHYATLSRADLHAVAAELERR